MINAAVTDNDPLMDALVHRNSAWSGRVRPRYCPRCGHELLTVGEYCSQCGLPIPPDERLYDEPDASPKSRLVALVLCVLLGYFGVHRFYVGKFVTGVIWLLTGGLFGIGYIVDIVMIAMGYFTDVDGLLLIFWD